MKHIPSLLSLKGVTKSFRGTVALRSVDFDTSPGEKIVGLVGPNGAGKTTLINTVTGYLLPDSGSVSCEGREITSWSPNARVKAGIVRTFQIPSTFDEMTVVENVAMAKQGATKRRQGFLREIWQRFPNTADEEDASQILSKFGLEDQAHRRVAEIPFGHKKTLELAMAYALQPKILLIDEPFSGLSDAEISETHAMIKSVSTEVSLVLMVEHKISWLTTLADRIVVMVEGKIIASGLPNEVMQTAIVKKMYWGES